MDYFKKRAYQDAVDRIAQALGKEMTPLERERAEAAKRSREPYALNPRIHNRTPHRAWVCPRKILARHPDKAWRRLGYEQARESHKAWGACCRIDGHYTHKGDLENAERMVRYPAWTTTPKETRGTQD